MSKYYLFGDKICDNGVALGNKSIVERLNNLFEDNLNLNAHISKLIKEKQELRNKLKETDKEITVLKEVIDKNKTGNFTSENVCNAISKFYEPLLKQLQNETAIKELDKVKEEFKLAFSFSTQQKMFDEYVDKRIKLLKGDK